jgi:hypothetical protein
MVLLLKYGRQIMGWRLSLGDKWEEAACVLLEVTWMVVRLTMPKPLYG